MRFCIQYSQESSVATSHTGLAELDRQQVRNAFSQSAGVYDEYAVLQREICARLLARLDFIRLQPATIVDLGCGTGNAIAELKRRYRKAAIIGLDSALPMLTIARQRLRWPHKLYGIGADAEALPIADERCDLVFSNLVLHWCNRPGEVFDELYRVLRPGGLLMFSTLGPDTLLELRRCWAEVDAYPHVHQFLDMHDIGDMMLRSRFSDPVMDAERLTLTYPSVAGLCKDLRNTGASNALCERRRGLTGKHKLQAMIAKYEQLRVDEVLPASVEIVYGHAWKTAPRVAVAKPTGSQTAFPLRRWTKR